MQPELSYAGKEQILEAYTAIADYFQIALETTAMCVDSIAEPLQSATEQGTHALMEGGTIRCCAMGPDRALAVFTADRLMMGSNEERPPLPAVAQTATAEGAGSLWRELRALAQHSDLILCIDSSDDGACLAGVSAAITGKNLPLVALCRTGIAVPSGPGSVTLITLPMASRSQLLTLQAMTLNCFCHLIEMNLFGTS